MPDWMLTLIMIPVILAPLALIGIVTRIPRSRGGQRGQWSAADDLPPRQSVEFPSPPAGPALGGQRLLDPDWMPPSMPRMHPPLPGPSQTCSCCCACHRHTCPKCGHTITCGFEGKPC